MPVLQPRTLSEACALLAEDPQRVAIAGGTDLLVNWPIHIDRHERTYLDLSKLDDLKSIEWSEDAVTLGAATTFWSVLRDSRFREDLPLLPKVAAQVGALQIQTRATWAGNVVNASPAADGAAALLALDATVELVSSTAVEQVPLADLFLGYKRIRKRPDQLIRAIHVPRRAYTTQIFEKVGARAAQSITKVSVTITRSEAGWRVVAGGMAPSVCRCLSLEQLLASETPISSPAELIPALRADLAPIDDIRSSAAYREHVMARISFAALSDICPWVAGWSRW